MNYKDQAKKIIFQVVNLLKPLAAFLVLMALLQAIGLMNSATFFAQTPLPEAESKDTKTVNDPEEEDFDYEFTIKDLTGNKIPFSHFKGKTVFLNLWATWCGPCRAEMPSIQKLYNNMDKEKVVFIMLSLDKDGDRGKVVDYLKQRDFTFTAYMPSGFLPSQLRVKVIPTTFVISRDGKVIKKEVGSMRYDTSKFQKFLQELSR